MGQVSIFTCFSVENLYTPHGYRALIPLNISYMFYNWSITGDGDASGKDAQKKTQTPSSKFYSYIVASLTSWICSNRGRAQILQRPWSWGCALLGFNLGITGIGTLQVKP